MMDVRITMPARLLGLRASSVAVGLFVLLSVTLMTAGAAEDEIKDMEVAELTASYDAIEAELLRRFQEQKDSGSSKLSDTIKALGHIRSKKAVSLLVDNIDIEPDAKSERVGDFYPVSITKARTLESVYVALYALQRIGVPWIGAFRRSKKPRKGNDAKCCSRDWRICLMAEPFLRVLATRRSETRTSGCVFSGSLERNSPVGAAAPLMNYPGPRR